jgi:hypothetical protein
MRPSVFVALSLLTLGCSAAPAQSSLVTGWENRVRSTSSQQPSWAVPVFTPSSGLVQLVRADMIRQITAKRTITWNIDGGKGLSLIPWYRTEVDINLPAYIEHNSASVKDGAGDLSLLLKYRILGANEKHGNYAASLAIAATSPTGSYKNGAIDGSISPTLCMGKGYGRLDIQSAASIALPTGHTATAGRPIAWNTAAQYKLGKYIWPEIETNATYFRGGANNGRNQSFVTPGMVLGKIKFSRNPQCRLGMYFGAGEQIAFSQYHAYNHALSMSTRIVF